MTFRSLATLIAFGSFANVALGQTLRFFAFQSICEGQPDCGWAAGKSLLVAGRLMVERINAGSFLRGNLKLELVEFDTLCSSTEGTRKAAAALMASELPFGVIGCSCSGCTMASQTILNIARMPMISNSATSTELSDRVLYPNFFRTWPADGPMIKSWFIIFQSFGWTTIAMWFDAAYGSNMKAYFLAVKTQYGFVDVLANKTDLVTMREATAEYASVILDEVMKTKVRGVMTMAYAPCVRQFICQVSKRNVRGMIVTYLGWFAPDWLVSGSDAHTCTEAQLFSASQYSITSNAPAWNSDSALLPCDTTGSYTVGDFADTYNARRIATGLEERREAGATGDAICMMAKLFNQMWDDGFSLDALYRMSESTYLSAVAKMQAMSFDGVSGTVSFPANGTGYGGGDRVGNFEIYQMFDGALDTIGEVVDGPSGMRVELLPSKSVLFDEGHTQADPPPERYPSCPTGEVYDFQKGACQACQAGEVFLEVMGACLCRPGYSSVFGGCAPCAKGRHSSNPGSSACDPCLAGSYAAQPGLPECEKCQVGTYTGGGLSGATACENCSLGMYANQKYSTACEPCRPDTEGRSYYSPLPGSSSCQLCPTGGLCEEDEHGLYTSYINSDGFYFMKAEEAVSSEQIGQLYRCTHGGGMACRAYGHCHADPSTGELAMEGPMCGVCRQGYGRQRTTDLCRRCPSELAAVAQSLLGLLPLAYIATIACTSAWMTDFSKPRVMRTIIFRQVLHYVQMLRSIVKFTTFVFDDTAEAESVLDGVVGFGMSVGDNAGDCLLQYLFPRLQAHQRFTIIMLAWIPLWSLIVCVIFGLGSGVRRVCGRPRLPRETLATVLVVNIFLVHPRVSALFLSTFECVRFDVARMLWDTSVICDSAHYYYWANLGLVGLAIFSFGIPLSPYSGTLQAVQKSQRTQKSILNGIS